ncbi:MAG: hypothetical protein NTZ16_16340 [Verrucomicrobia bacterium]|nr:hypothetical protein [Verrucomicrobiota bacterium]
MLYNINTREGEEGFVEATFDGKKWFNINKESLLKVLKDERALVDSLDMESRFKLLLALKTDTAKKHIIGGSVVKVLVGSKLKYGVVIGFNEQVDVWIAGTDRLRFISVDWSCILPIGERVSVGMESMPHTIPTDTWTKISDKYGR